MAAAASATRRACDGGAAAKLAEMARAGVTADEMTRTAVCIDALQYENLP
jgi:hypothetical protein